MLYIFIVVNYNYVAFTKILHFVKKTPPLVKEENSQESRPLPGSPPHTPFLFPFPAHAS